MTLGLFPLNIVLFPGAQVPLHVYETRYKALVNECLTGGGMFGINLVEQGHMFPIGCAARVAEITQKYDDGRMDIIAEGTHRYRLLGIREDDKPYAIGETEDIVDDIEPIDSGLVEKCADMYNQIIDLVYGDAGPRFDPLASFEMMPSFFMAPKSGLSTDQKQRLLESVTENDRLELILDHLNDIVPTVRQAELVQRVIRSDGYFPVRQ
ncbi:MAG: LON peptidase substrate-binding domain-containing protein [bacterium]|nr:LON peptidase substrate-binding domain-containing protein [bacterium]